MEQIIIDQIESPLKSTRFLRRCFSVSFIVLMISLVINAFLPYLFFYSVGQMTGGAMSDGVGTFYFLVMRLIYFSPLLVLLALAMFVVSYMGLMLRLFENSKRLKTPIESEYKKIWCVLGWLIPLIHLSVPYKMMKYIWQSYFYEREANQSKLIGYWWGAVILAQISFVLILMVEGTREFVFGIFTLLCFIVAFVLQLKIFKKLSKIENMG